MDNQLTIYLISGPLGVGKSSLCKMIQDELGYSYVDGDSVFVPLENKDLSWNERLKISWEWIVDQTRKYIVEGRNVVIDFVVEDELPWFTEQVSDLNVKIRYVVLIAEKLEIKKRLEKRDGTPQYFDRSNLLLTQLKSDRKNQPYLLDTTDKNTFEVFEIVTQDNRFELE